MSCSQSLHFTLENAVNKVRSHFGIESSLDSLTAIPESARPQNKKELVDDMLRRCLSCHYGNHVGSDFMGRYEQDFNWEYRTIPLKALSAAAYGATPFHMTALTKKGKLSDRLEPLHI